MNISSIGKIRIHLNTKPEQLFINIDEYLSDEKIPASEVINKQGNYPLAIGEDGNYYFPTQMINIYLIADNDIIELGFCVTKSYLREAFKEEKALFSFIGKWSGEIDETHLGNEKYLNETGSTIDGGIVIDKESISSEDAIWAAQELMKDFPETIGMSISIIDREKVELIAKKLILSDEDFDGHYEGAF